MQALAISRGTPVSPPSFTGSVHSVFPQAINIELPQSGGWLTLLTAASADQPGAVRLNAQQMPPGWGIHPGQAVTCIQESLHIPAAGFHLSLRGLTTVDCCFPAGPPTGEVQAAHNALHTCLEEQASLFDLPAVGRVPFRQRLVHFTHQLAGAFASHDRSGAGAAVEGLIGLGPGLTPSGDDILVGFLAGISAPYFCRQLPTAFLPWLYDQIARAAERTNAISRQFLRHALRGFFDMDLLRFITALGVAPQDPQMSSLAQRVLSKGHSSGLDVLYGTRAALAALGRLAEQ